LRAQPEAAQQGLGFGGRPAEPVAQHRRGRVGVASLAMESSERSTSRRVSCDGIQACGRNARRPSSSSTAVAMSDSVEPSPRGKPALSRSAVCRRSLQYMS
jgi:hypothetical protein